MTTVHRLLDDAFAGVELTPEVQDLKEEIRANLEARAAELEAGGVAPDDAARRRPAGRRRAGLSRRSRPSGTPGGRPGASVSGTP